MTSRAIDDVEMHDIALPNGASDDGLAAHVREKADHASDNSDH
jgi:hypothetical protein